MFRSFSLLLSCSGFKKESSKTSLNETFIETSPLLPEGQSLVLELRCPPNDTVRVGFIGVGMRGASAVSRFTKIEGAKIVAICDLEQFRLDFCQQLLTDSGVPQPAYYVGKNAWKKVCKRADLDLIYIATPWELHTLC